MWTEIYAGLPNVTFIAQSSKVRQVRFILTLWITLFVSQSGRIRNDSSSNNNLPISDTIAHKGVAPHNKHKHYNDAGVADNSEPRATLCFILCGEDTLRK